MMCVLLALVILKDTFSQYTSSISVKYNAPEVNITCNMNYGISITKLQVENPPLCKEMNGRGKAMVCELDANEENTIKEKCNSYTSCTHVFSTTKECKRPKPMEFRIQFECSVSGNMQSPKQSHCTNIDKLNEMECNDSTSITAVNGLHILSGDIHYKQSNCSGLQTKMLKDIKDKCIDTGECDLDFLHTYVKEECAMMIPYITVDFTCLPPVAMVIGAVIGCICAVVAMLTCILIVCRFRNVILKGHDFHGQVNTMQSPVQNYATLESMSSSHYNETSQYTEIEQVPEHSTREESITDERSHKLDSHVEITSMDDQRANYFVLDPTETGHNRSDSSAHAQSTGYFMLDPKETGYNRSNTASDVQPTGYFMLDPTETGYNRSNITSDVQPTGYFMFDPTETGYNRSDVTNETHDKDSDSTYNKAKIKDSESKTDGTYDHTNYRSNEDNQRDRNDVYDRTKDNNYDTANMTIRVLENNSVEYDHVIVSE